MLEERRSRPRERGRARGAVPGLRRPPRSRHDSGDGRSALRAWLATFSVVMLGSSAAVIAAGAIGRGPLHALGWQEQRIQPQTWRLPAGDGRVIDIGFAVASRESCGGTFSVQVRETSEAVVVGAVVQRVPRVNVGQLVQPECDVPVPADGRVFATVDLSAPLDGRQVIREQDRQVLVAAR